MCHFAHRIWNINSQLCTVTNLWLWLYIYKKKFCDIQQQFTVIVESLILSLRHFKRYTHFWYNKNMFLLFVRMVYTQHLNKNKLVGTFGYKLKRTIGTYWQHLTINQLQCTFMIILWCVCVHGVFFVVESQYIKKPLLCPLANNVLWVHV